MHLNVDLNWLMLPGICKLNLCNIFNIVSLPFQFTINDDEYASCLQWMNYSSSKSKKNHSFESSSIEIGLCDLQAFCC